MANSSYLPICSQDKGLPSPWVTETVYDVTARVSLSPQLTTAKNQLRRNCSDMLTTVLTGSVLLNSLADLTAKNALQRLESFEVTTDAARTAPLVTDGHASG